MKVKYLHELKSKEIDGENVFVHEEYIIHGEKGLLIKHYHKEKGKKVKHIIKQDGENFKFIVDTDGKKDEKTMSKNDLLKEIGKEKYLKFAVDFLKSQKGGKYMEISMERPKKGSKKSSKKRSIKKRSKKSSRK
jgi:hypothetical protein